MHHVGAIVLLAALLLGGCSGQAVSASPSGYSQDVVEAACRIEAMAGQVSTFHQQVVDLVNSISVTKPQLDQAITQGKASDAAHSLDDTMHKIAAYHAAHLSALPADLASAMTTRISSATTAADAVVQWLDVTAGKAPTDAFTNLGALQTDLNTLVGFACP